MKVLLLLLYSVVLFVSIVKVIFGYTLWWAVIGVAILSFLFIDWDNMPWLMLKWKY